MSGDLIPEIPDGAQWWDAVADNAVRPDVDAILVDGVRVARGSRVRLHPARRADAQDLFFSGKTARVTSVHEDVDGNQHVAVVLEDDPAADLHDWYGRYLYFAPDEVEPLEARVTDKESDMEIVGWVFIGILSLVVLAAVVMGLVSLPDARRYLRIRHM